MVVKHKEARRRHSVVMAASGAAQGSEKEAESKERTGDGVLIASLLHFFYVIFTDRCPRLYKYTAEPQLDDAHHYSPRY